MKSSLTHKFVLLTPPGAIVDAAALTTAALDTKGFNHVDLYCVIGATDIAMDGLKVRESDDDGVADAYADVPNADFATGTLPDGEAATLPGAGDDNKIFAFHIDMNGRKRYLDVVATGGDGAAGAYFTVFAVLSKPQIMPSDAAGRGLAAELNA